MTTIRIETEIPAPPDRPRSFTDEQVRGPFASFVHCHTFLARDKGTLMIDEWTHTPPWGPLGKIADRVLARHMERVLRTRATALLYAARDRR